MNLIKIGTRIINLDNVTNVRTSFQSADHRIGTRVYFGAESETFYGIDADALTSFLNDRATDVISILARQLEKEAYFTNATARPCSTCGGEGDCPDCDPRP